MDGDGEITTEELKCAMIKLMGEHMNRREIDAIVKEADDNGDGTVDFEGTNCPSNTSTKHWCKLKLVEALMRTRPESGKLIKLLSSAEFVRMMSHQ